MEVKDALDMYEAYKTYWAENYREANIDLKMAAGDPAAHWGEGWDESFQMLKGEPYPVVNELPQYIHQVTNDIRQNTPSIKVIPEQDGDVQTAEVFGDILRGIEYKSCADEAYDTAAEYMVTCGIGFAMVDHDYCDDDSDLQELQIKTVPDPLSVLFDPASVECDGRDACGAIVLEPINKKDFERLYKGKTFVSFTDPKAKDQKDSIVLANIFIKEVTGGTVDKGKRTPRKTVIRRYKFSGEDQLAETTSPGIYIPVVPFYGEVKWIDGKRVLASLIRQARGPQRRLNHWAKKESQLLNMAPIAPVMAEEGTLVNERGQWQSPGKETVLEYRKTNLDGQPGNIPTRLQPPPIPTGIINAMQGAKDNIKESMGIYNAGLGKREGDASGRALNALQKEGDVATFHFPDNVRRSITQIGRIAVSAAPEILDTARVVQAVNEETEVSSVGINGAPLQPGQDQPYDLRKGKYHVRVTTGASYTTKRQEEAQFLTDIAKQDPNFMQIGGDILFKSMDTPGAQALAARYKKVIPQQLLDDKEQMQDPRVPQLEQAIQELQGQLQQAGAQLQDKQAKEQIDAQKNQLDAGKLQLEQQKLALDAKKLDIEAFKAKADVATAMQPKQPEAAPTQPVNNDIHPDMSEEQILGALDQRRQAAEQAAMDQQNQAMLEQQEQERQIAIQQATMLQEQQANELRAQQGQAIITLLGSVAQQLGDLTAAVNKPKSAEIMRSDGSMVRAVLQ
jgi:hypothetical protein